MAQVVGKYAANAFLKKHMKGYANKKVDSGNDPYFAMIEDPRRPGKFKKVKKQIPAYIPEHDAMVLASVRKNAYRLDMCLFNLFGIRFGWEAVIGLIPFAGDAAGVALALMIVRKCATIDGGLDSTLRFRMILNILLDFFVGLVPFIGDLADAAYKCNTRNVRLLEVYLDKKYKPKGNGGRDAPLHASVDKKKRESNRRSGIFLPHDPPPATVFEDSDEDDNIHDATSHPADPSIQRPAPAQEPAASRRNGGWFGNLIGGGAGSNARNSPHDLEMGQQQTGRVRA